MGEHLGKTGRLVARVQRQQSPAAHAGVGEKGARPPRVLTAHQIGVTEDLDGAR
jgi:hypothetical protein